MSILTTSPRADEGAYKPRIVPSCKVYAVPGVGDVCGFAKLEDWKLVLDADSELYAKREGLRLERLRTADLTIQVESLEGQIKEYEGAQKVLIAGHDKLVADLLSLDEKYQNERVKPRWGNPIAWSVAALSVAVLGGFLLSDVIDRL
jgi:hypothetical protein